MSYYTIDEDDFWDPDTLDVTPLGTPPVTPPMSPRERICPPAPSRPERIEFYTSATARMIPPLDLEDYDYDSDFEDFND